MLEKKIILVTGGAHGIGRAAVRCFADYGAGVAVVDLDHDAAETVAADIRSRGGRAAAFCTDVSDEKQVERMVAQVQEEFGGLDGAFNNAGVETLNLPFHQIPLSGWRKVMAVDLDGVFFCMKHQISAFLKSGRSGTIVNTASVLGQLAMRNAAEYVAAKHGVIGLTRAAAIEYGELGIRINAVLPGIIETDIMKRLTQDPQVKAALVQMRAAHPIGRFGQPQEIGEVAAWLLSERSSFVTGAAIDADGGYQAV